MNYAGIKYCDIANGSGCRTVLFVSGCRNACKGCFQPQTWDFCYGKPFDEAVQQEVIDSLEPEYITGITLLGGEPFEPENQAALLPFMKKVKKKYPNKNVWAFTGYIYDKDIRKWIEKAKATRNMALTNFAYGIEKDWEAVQAAIDIPFSNGLLEGTVNKIKALKRQMYNRAGSKLLRAKILYSQ